MVMIIVIIVIIDQHLLDNLDMRRIVAILILRPVASLLQTRLRNLGFYQSFGGYLFAPPGFLSIILLLQYIYLLTSLVS